MAIQILPARLANQIAAGEVVERPASVVKELVENSIDAGATRVDIDIEKGGSKLIRIRDNGSGIVKDELELALSRHATSKISCLDDLEAIVSLGFRGEALASISSVSRLTMTSRTVTQAEAWSAYAEGRDMSVQIKPAAHPVGTTVEVVDLFFNTPARRKFLRTDKTEFGYIDELIKRIALSRFDVAITLRHNGTIVRQYRAAENGVQKERRLAAICGSQFVKTAVEVSLEHQGLTLHGWICTPDGARAQNDIQHCFVNQRMMKDKLINHAIRQGYEASLRPDQFAAYVLYIDIDPHQVDVNVHPAKHEVRFHQARLVHDFIYQAVADALMQVMAEQQAELAGMEQEASQQEAPDVVSPTESYIPAEEASSQHVAEVAKASYTAGSSEAAWRSQTPSPGATRGAASYGSSERSNYGSNSDGFAGSGSSKGNSSAGYSGGQSSGGHASGSYTSGRQERFGESAPSKRDQRVYRELMTTPVVPQESKQYVPRQDAHAREFIGTSQHQTPVNHAPVSIGHADKGLGKALTVMASKYLLLQRQEGLALLDLDSATELNMLGQFRAAEQEGLKAQPLLIPQAIPASSEEIALLTKCDGLLTQFGIIIRQKSSNQIMVMAVCQPIRRHNLQQFVPALLTQLRHLEEQERLSGDNLARWLASEAVQKTDVYGLSQAVTLITELENCWQGELAEYFSLLLRPVDVAAAIEAFKHE
ncbi:DNA mismatch repair endonuclease MutL [Enterovibrio nigricans]|uniref:DNA mismatch repair protein MutL n=1 Tax=Enterovibrio nigricans DSM 22720 TaxID=1121868 RepID=A0A1T4UTZ3_9GAMM|nr:DNA mismatch repair endonuclease MutL [Enterovibrio nigricans]PKF50127.1 DNA mismatch repair endonuclease MutL [Enterovibrio nigricans]SKA55891.1 DNA mismatch repair protein MutL [Enterovibrio nigricans DSM 22720]